MEARNEKALATPQNMKLAFALLLAILVTCAFPAESITPFARFTEVRTRNNAVNNACGEEWQTDTTNFGLK